MTDSGNSSGTGKPVVRAQRRRKGTDASVPRQRAQAPRREGRRTARTTPTTEAPAGGETGGIGTGRGALGPLLATLLRGAASGSGSTGKRAGGCSLRTLIIVVVIILVVAYLLTALGECGQGLGDLGQATPAELAGDAGSGSVTEPLGATATPAQLQPVEQPTRPIVVPGQAATGASWLVMLYQDADDQILEKDIYVDLNEAERAGSTANVHIVSQIDRFRGAYAADGDWTGARRYYVTQDADLNRVGSQLIADIGEANMAEGNTLVDFVTWAMASYPADRYALIMSDHGMGWPGGWTDPDPGTRSANTAPIAASLGNQMYLDELESALRTITRQTGVDKLDLVGLDACLMGQLEVFSTLAPYARYAVASEETEPALGWAYASFLEALARDPAMDGSELSRLIVNSYVREDERIVDDDARAELLRQGSPMGGWLSFTLPTSDQIADQMTRAVTLSAVDLARIQPLTNRVNELSLALQQADQRVIARAREYARSFTSVFGRNVPASYIDLGHLAGLIQQNTTGAVQAAAGNVVAALDEAVIAETHGPDKSGATGVAIYFPNSQLFRTPQTGPQSYTVIADTFANTSLWDDYLSFHYTGRSFEADALEAVVPEPGASVTAPGGGEFSMTPVQSSRNRLAIGETAVLTTEITARNLGHVLLFAGYYDRLANSLMVADMDYLEAPDTRELEGVYYPVWPDGTFILEFEWEPIVYSIYDGQDAVMATLTPQTYGATSEEAVYTVDGIYTYGSGDGSSRYARLYLANGTLQRVYGFTGDQFSGAPREIHPQTGDTFTVLRPSGCQAGP